MRPRHKYIGLVVAAILIGVLTGCSPSRPVYTFKPVTATVPAGQTNLLTDASFESATTKICIAACKTGFGWAIEHSTPGAPTLRRTSEGVVTGAAAEAIEYKGQHGDNGIHKMIELFQGASVPQTTTGRELTFTLWVSGTCTKCTPFIGIEAFNAHGQYLGESDQYFHPPSQPKPVQVSYLLPPDAIAVAGYIQVPELYGGSQVNLHVDNAILTAASQAAHPTTSPTHTEPRSTDGPGSAKS